MADGIAPGATGINVEEVKRALDEGGVRFLPGRELREVGDHAIVLRDRRTRPISTHPFDAVVLSLGVRGNHELHAALDGRERVCEIGTGCTPGRIAEAIRSAREGGEAMTRAGIERLLELVPMGFPEALAEGVMTFPLYVFTALFAQHYGEILSDALFYPHTPAAPQAARPKAA